MLTGWKTLIFSAAVALLGVAQSADWVHILDASSAGYIVTGIGVTSAILRLVTSTPAGKSG